MTVAEIAVTVSTSLSPATSIYRRDALGENYFNCDNPAIATAKLTGTVSSCPYREARGVGRANMDCDASWVEKIITEVEKKPVIYNKALPQYSDKQFKKQAWDEVFEAVVDSWSLLSPEEKLRKGIEVQQRWRNLKCCFQREIREQRKATTGLVNGKRRRYVYFEQLSFLLPTIMDWPTSANNDSLLNVPPALEFPQDVPDISCGSSQVKIEDDLQSIPSITHRPVSPLLLTKRPAPFEESPRPEVGMTTSDEGIDEDKYFLLSLLPAMKRLKRELKFEAKVEMLRVMNGFERVNQH